jgi:hypothetical protein
MFAQLCRHIRSICSPGRPCRTPRPLALERLEDRAVPANVAVLGSTLFTSTSIRLSYRVSDVTQFDVGIYRSADPIFSADDIAITSATINARKTTWMQYASIPLSGEMPIDTAHPYVLTVADPHNSIGETNEADNIGQFRKLTLAVITHGLEPSGKLPSWLDDMAAGLKREGFAEVLEFDWAAASRLPLPGTAYFAGLRMAYQVRIAANALGNRPTDVVDVQFIGHSRGAVVISQALLSLQRFPGTRKLALGYFEFTMLDPHPAMNRGTLAAGLAELNNGTGVSTIGGFTFDPTNIVSSVAARATLVFQAATRDPLVVIPSNVDKAEEFYQRLPWFDTAPDGFEFTTRFNLLGELPVSLINRSAKPIDFVEISQPPENSDAGHTSVQIWYIENLLPPAGP